MTNDTLIILVLQLFVFTVLTLRLYKLKKEVQRISRAIAFADEVRP